MIHLKVMKQCESFSSEEMDKEVKDMLGKINIYDASTDVMKQAADYFKKLSDKHFVKKEALIQINSLDSKPEIIVALKKNELAVLDQLLVDKKK